MSAIRNRTARIAMIASFAASMGAGSAALPAAAQDAPAAPEAPAAPNAAQAQFTTSCGVCHAVEPGAAARQGPNLSGIYGRAAGSLPEFKYSAALKEGGWVWDEATLDPWIENAQAVHPGTTMNYRQRDADKRKAIVAYLKTLTRAP